jgi:uncharacterized protein YciW
MADEVRQRPELAERLAAMIASARKVAATPIAAPSSSTSHLSNSGSRCWRACRRSRWGSSGIRART